MMLLGAALMRSGWLKGQYSLHYRRTVLLAALANDQPARGHFANGG